MPLRFLGGLTSSQITNILMSTIPPELQADAKLDQAAPVQNTWYTVLDTTNNVRVLIIFCGVLLASETIELELTIDGRTITLNRNITFNGEYYASLNVNANGNFCVILNSSSDGDVPIDTRMRPFMIDCRSFKCRIRKTTANGAGNLSCTVVYQQW